MGILVAFEDLLKKRGSFWLPHLSDSVQKPLLMQDAPAHKDPMSYFAKRAAIPCPADRNVWAASSFLAGALGHCLSLRLSQWAAGGSTSSGCLAHLGYSVLGTAHLPLVLMARSLQPLCVSQLGAGSAQEAALLYLP